MTIFKLFLFEIISNYLSLRYAHYNVILAGYWCLYRLGQFQHTCYCILLIEKALHPIALTEYESNWQ